MQGEEDDCKLPALEVSLCGACSLHGVRAPVSVTAVRTQAVQLFLIYRRAITGVLDLPLCCFHGSFLSCQPPPIFPITRPQQHNVQHVLAIADSSRTRAILRRDEETCTYFRFLGHIHQSTKNTLNRAEKAHFCHHRHLAAVAGVVWCRIHVIC